jgi:hypothetical protein
MLAGTLLLSLLTGCGLSGGKEEDDGSPPAITSTRIGQIMTPDMTKEFTPVGRGGTSVKQFNAPDARVKPFLFEQQYFQKQYRSEDYAGLKGYDSGDYRTDGYARGEEGYQTGRPNLLSSSDANLSRYGQAPGTSDYAVAGASESGRDAGPGRAWSRVREAPMRGKSQHILDQQHGKREPLTMGEVRELLNKN